MLFSLTAAVSTIHHLTRVCARCGRSQVVTRAQRSHETRCRACLAKLPPPPRAR